MTAEQNKDLVLRTWQAMFAGDAKTAFANMSDEVSWLVPGSLQNLGGLKKGKDAIAELFRSVAKMFPSGLKTEIRRTYADGDTVILEVVNRGKLFNGRDYENDYCFVFEIENGKIRRVREYVDTLKVKELIG